MKPLLPLIAFLVFSFVAKSQVSKIFETSHYSSGLGDTSLTLYQSLSYYKTGSICRADSTENRYTHIYGDPITIQSHSEIKYNANGYIATETTQNIDTSNPGNFINAYLNSYTYYNNTDQQLTVLGQGWNGQSWFDSSLQTNTYNANGLLQSTTYQIKNGNGLANDQRFTYTYDGVNLVDQLTENWNTSLSVWKAIERLKKHYNNKNVVDTSVTSTFSDNGQEEAATRSIYSYDNNNLLLGFYTDQYQSGVWKNTGRLDIYYFNTGKIESIENYYRSGDIFSLVYTQDFTYTANGNKSSETLSISGMVEVYKYEYDPCADVVMPIQLLDFKAVKQKKNVLLSWSTATEENSSYFQIERSQDNLNFVAIGKQAAAGNSNTRLNYTYTDNIESLTNVKKVFYRLKEVDKDGKYMYSPIVFVPTGNEVRISIVPNPAKNYINILHDNNTDLSGSVISIIDISGKTVLKQKYQNKNIPVANFARGVYIIQLTMPSGTITRKLIIN